MRSVVRRTFGVVIASSVLGGLVAAAAAPAYAVGCRSWKVQPSPNPGGMAHNNVLGGVAGTSGSNVWAVGDVDGYTKGPTARTLVEHWNGRAWEVQKSPNPGGAGMDDNYLQKVAATSPTNAWAVGEYFTASGSRGLIEHWNGKAWSVQKSANPAGTDVSLLGVAAISDKDAWAVGSTSNGIVDQTFVEHWNGRAWKVQKSPNPGGIAHTNDLNSVTVISPTDAWAVGEYQTATADHTLTEHWNGRAWKVKPSPVPEGSSYQLSRVAASSSTDAWAVGEYVTPGLAQQTLVEHWNGKAWKVEKTPNPGGTDNLLFGVVATSASDVWVGGYSSSHSLFEHWNGTAWTIPKSPNPGSKGNLIFGMAASSANNMWAVGAYYNGSNARTLTMHCG